MRWLISALIGLGMGFASQAQDSATPTILTPAMVENLIASYPVVKEKVDQLREQFDVPDDADGAAAWRAWTAVDGAKAQLDDTVRSYGFSDFSAWVRALSITAQVYAFTGSGEDIDSQMAEALQRIESDPNISEAQKEMMRQQLSHSVTAITAMKPSQASIDAVKPYAEQLSRLFEK